MKRRQLIPYRLFLIVLFLSLLAPHLVGQEDAALKERIRQAAAQYTLDLPDMKPWHLNATFELFDPSTQATQAGTIEEWWAAPNLHKVVYTIGSESWTELENDRGSYWSSDEEDLSELPRHLLHQIVHPLPSVQQIDKYKFSLAKKQAGDITYDCITPHPLDKSLVNSWSATAIYCFDGKGKLAAASEDRTELIFRDKVGVFGNKLVPVEETINFGSQLAATIHITKLRQEILTEGDFAPPADAKWIDNAPVELEPAIKHGRLLKQVPPTYPDNAKRERIMGTVMLHAIVGVDGHFHSIKKVYSPSPYLTAASIAAVRQWAFEPSTLNGKPVSTETNVMMNFEFSH